MAHDLYGEARSLGVALWDAGHATWSARIDDVLRGGATPTEILMRLRWTLDSLVEAQPGLTPELWDQVRETRSALDAALR